MIGIEGKDGQVRIVKVTTDQIYSIAVIVMLLLLPGAGAAMMVYLAGQAHSAAGRAEGASDEALRQVKQLEADLRQIEQALAQQGLKSRP